MDQKKVCMYFVLYVFHGELPFCGGSWWQAETTSISPFFLADMGTLVNFSYTCFTTTAFTSHHIFLKPVLSLSLCINIYMLWKRTQFHTIPSNLLTSLEEENKHSYAMAIFEGSIVWSTIPPVCPTCRRHTYNFSELSTAFTWVKYFLAPNTIMQFLSC